MEHGEAHAALERVDGGRGGAIAIARLRLCAGKLAANERSDPEGGAAYA